MSPQIGPNQAPNRRSNSSSGLGKGLIVAWVAAFFLFSVGGIGAAIGVLIIMATIVFLIVRASLKSGSSHTAPAGSGYRRPSAPYHPVSPSRPSMMPVSSSGHLCDPGQHQEELRDGTEALNDMQEGYGDYNAKRNRAPGYRSEESFSGIAPGGRMTREQFVKKTQELRSLLDAGIITQEEYRAKMNEYSRYVV